MQTCPSATDRVKTAWRGRKPLTIGQAPGNETLKSRPAKAARRRPDDGPQWCNPHWLVEGRGHSHSCAITMKKRKPESIPNTEDASLPCGRAAAGVAQDVAHAGLLVQVRETIYLARPRCSCPWPGLCPGEPATLAIRQHRAGRGMALALMSYRRYSCPCYGHTASAAIVSAPSDGAAHALLRLSMRPGHSAFARCALGSNRELCRAPRQGGNRPCTDIAVQFLCVRVPVVLAGSHAALGSVYACWYILWRGGV